jgi:hypothetical protein
MYDSMIVDLLVIATRIIWPSGTYIKECADVLTTASEVQSDAGPCQQAVSTGTAGKASHSNDPQLPLTQSDERDHYDLHGNQY